VLSLDPLKALHPHDAVPHVGNLTDLVVSSPQDLSSCQTPSAQHLDEFHWLDGNVRFGAVPSPRVRTNVRLRRRSMDR
jgi:hypothetical protein